MLLLINDHNRSTLQVNLLSVVLNDAPILPEADEDVTSLLKDSPQCMAFGLFMIWLVLYQGKLYNL